MRWLQASETTRDAIVAIKSDKKFRDGGWISSRVEGDCKIVVFTARGGQTKLGFDAPRDIHIVRDEVLQRDKRDQP